MQEFDNKYSQPFDQNTYKLAQRRVQAKLDFYRHLVSYVVVNGLLVGIYLFTCLAVGGLYYPWFIWPMAGWGIGLVFHFLNTFVFNDGVTTQRMIEEEMRRMRR